MCNLNLCTKTVINKNEGFIRVLFVTSSMHDQTMRFYLSAVQQIIALSDMLQCSLSKVLIAIL